MQLTRSCSFRATLTAVTAVLIGGGAARAAEGDKLQSSLLLYSETNRVQAAEGIVSLSHPLEGGRSVSGRLSFDALTGPSPNGAAPSDKVQLFTRASGSGSYSVQPGEIPLDETFQDTRLSFDGSYNIPVNRLTTLDLGAHLSNEHDYTSFGANIGLTHDFNRRNTTVSLAGSASHDLVHPQGGAPDPFSAMLSGSGGNDGFGEGETEQDFEGGNGGPSETKNVLDAVIGLTQVIDRHMLMRVNYSINHSSGYLNDPYKILSLVQDQSGTAPGETVGYVYESRPSRRSEHAVFGEIQRYIGGHTINLSYRYFWDDWGVRSNTIDFHYRFPLHNGHALQPHVRWYRQTGADFYRSYVFENGPMPNFASADYRLAPFHAMTLGMQYLLPIAERAEFSIGGDYYWQSGDISPPEGLGPLSQYKLFPDMKAIMVRIGVNYDF